MEQIWQPTDDDLAELPEAVKAWLKTHPGFECDHPGDPTRTQAARVRLADLMNR